MAKRGIVFLNAGRRMRKGAIIETPSMSSNKRDVGSEGGASGLKADSAPEM